VAGASGAVGRRLTPLLRQRGYEVTGTTRSAAKAAELERAGVNALVLDVFDERAVTGAIAAARPAVVIHQLTDLSGGFGPEHLLETLSRNARIRTEGTRNLVLAAGSVGVRRMIAQSIVWMYAPGPVPHREDDPLDVAAQGTRAINVRGVVALERAVLEASPLEGVVLRYGWLYGPGANDKPAGRPGLHVDAAANAAVLAIEQGTPGAYNIAEPGPLVSIDKAERELGWDPGFRA
jgi:nucleoside-diphosphate-sugar epimerase